MADTTYRNEPVFIYFASPPPDAGHGPEAGWWGRIGNYDPEGPFDSQAEAARSLARNLTEAEEMMPWG